VTARERLDRVLVARGLAPTREKAQALILAGRVRVGGERAEKAGSRVAEDAAIEVDDAPRWVGRGAVKLEHALRRLGVAAASRRALDVGASTGGFTQALLAAGAASVAAVEVGRGQLDWTLRNDPRVAVLEGTNARHLRPEALPFAPDLAVVDVSFISLRAVLPAVAACLAPPGEIVALVKPQFEVGPADAPRGVVRDEGARERAVEKVADFARSIGLNVLGRLDSPLRGPAGNREILLHLSLATG
jgi:23S rRNA (cytidine1920-2'-O)/16S rRNA (cytidine1409-2'-O)-methyltransferase